MNLIVLAHFYIVEEAALGIYLKPRIQVHFAGGKICHGDKNSWLQKLKLICGDTRLMRVFP